MPQWMTNGCQVFVHKNLQPVHRKQQTVLQMCNSHAKPGAGVRPARWLLPFIITDRNERGSCNLQATLGSSATGGECLV